MSRDCSSRKDYSQELPRRNRKRLEKCSTEYLIVAIHFARKKKTFLTLSDLLLEYTS